ncbi:uncharacterized protein KY384_006110 [Bacidia gigantensis]|uniref:uncharacterized protein n=1 Tax=Bacidia gigantensis TaxID=2732470 RepID=UPI001D03DF14|nr:uncharacterized protein KY384_006110 [Bacidia gigantensis]KAG8529473.1 hypothetical protein KY384_006110 [Bacidia gigantensis]
MTSRYTLHEPFPTYSSKTSMPFGRGGAGNQVSPEKRNKLPPSTITATQHSHQGPNYSTGRGGAGNMHSSGEDRAMFHFDEELERERRLNKNPAPVYHVGRGGGGNVVDKRRGSEASEASGKSSARGSLDFLKGLGKKL